MFDNYYVVCSNCQARNPLTNDFCNNCGERLVKNSDSSKGVVTVFQKVDESDKFVGSGSNLTTDNNEEVIGETESNKQGKVSDEIQKRFCPNCGNKIVSGAKFCTVCGFKLNNDNSTQEETIKSDTVNFNTNTNRYQQTDNNFKSLIILAILFVVAVSGYGIYKHATYLPKGLTDSDQIMKQGSSQLSGKLFMYVAYHQQVIDNGKYLVYIYKNSRTDRYVFPVRDSKDNSKHYCYLYRIVGTKYLVDINNSNWCYTLNGAGVKIIGNNPSEWEYKMDAQYYNDNIKNMKEWQQENNY